MTRKNFIGRKIALGAMALSFLFMTSGIALAQENPAAKPQTTVQQDSWETWKQDTKKMYQQLREQADRIKADAQAKKISDPALKDAIDKFEASAKAFSEKWSTVDQVTADKKEQFKTDVTAAWNKVKSSFDELKAKWDSVNK